MKTYTIADHVGNLKKMLEMEFPCGHCPGIWHGLSNYKTIKLGCDICRSFIGINDKNTYPTINCPCNVLGKEEALKRTLIALEEYESKK